MLTLENGIRIYTFADAEHEQICYPLLFNKYSLKIESVRYFQNHA